MVSAERDRSGSVDSRGFWRRLGAAIARFSNPVPFGCLLWAAIFGLLEGRDLPSKAGWHFPTIAGAVAGAILVLVSVIFYQRLRCKFDQFAHAIDVPLSEAYVLGFVAATILVALAFFLTSRQQLLVYVLLGLIWFMMLLVPSRGSFEAVFVWFLTSLVFTIVSILPIMLFVGWPVIPLLCSMWTTTYSHIRELRRGRAAQPKADLVSL